MFLKKRRVDLSRPGWMGAQFRGDLTPQTGNHLPFYSPGRADSKHVVSFHRRFRCLPQYLPVPGPGPPIARFREAGPVRHEALATGISFGHPAACHPLVSPGEMNDIVLARRQQIDGL